MDIYKKSTVLITCSPGLVTYLQTEVENLGFKIQSNHKAGLEITTAFQDCRQLNLQLRTALNVLFLLKHFNCTSADQLYRQISSIEWENIISPQEYLCVVSRIDTPAVNNSMFVNMKVKDAIADRILQKVGSRPNSGPEKDNVVISLYWKKDRCWLYLNTSGRKLANRNYRKMPHTAPMQETLAAAVILAADYNSQQSLVVPMCGSGTLAIEAALIALNRAPGLLRSNYGFMHLKNFDKEQWQKLRKETLKSSRKQLPCRIIASDIDERAIDAARKNAKTAGVDHLIEFYTCDFADTPIPEEKGIVILNPEYGYRLGEIKMLEQIYKRMGDFFKQKCSGYTGYIFTGNMSLAKKVGLKASRRIVFFNADIECRLLKYEIYSGSKLSPRNI